MTTVKRTFTRDEWEDLGLPDDCGYLNDAQGEVISNAIIDHKRWTVVRRVVFRLPDQADHMAYRVDYSVPATESRRPPLPVHEVTECDETVVETTGGPL